MNAIQGPLSWESAATSYDDMVEPDQNLIAWRENLGKKCEDVGYVPGFIGSKSDEQWTNSQLAQARDGSDGWPYNFNMIRFLNTHK